MTAPRPYALLAELSYRCPLHCPYCSNPTHARNDGELTTDEWHRVLREATELGVLQVGFSGGEPLVRRDLAELVRGAREARLYTNLITSGVGLDEARASELREAGLDSVQLSFQSDDADLGDEIAGVRAHQRKLAAASFIRAADISLSLNFVIHRHNIDRLPQMIGLAEALGAERVELANVQFYGWAFLNRAALLPTREQVARAREVATAAKSRLAGKVDIFYVLPDYYETRPKPCLNGWGQRYLTVNPIGDVLPCPTASSAIPDLRFESVRARSLDWIWRESEGFNRFRGTEWMLEPCRSCPQKEIDFGGCRCQAALLTGNAGNTDPVCTLSPNRARVDAALRDPNLSSTATFNWMLRVNPSKEAAAPLDFWARP
ncbi:MAG TPA: pyrroloquinoline quinone biosynthesis protein PqqE [Chthoniobacterales bacterium]|jgi:pyrroloquinoline quinone biosynthesis protein E|nr:pyrroloquinoline quinone biosynthesis protein PqqE [Chthoniobacterales bacterium]